MIPHNLQFYELFSFVQYKITNFSLNFSLNMSHDPGMTSDKSRDIVTAAVKGFH